MTEPERLFVLEYDYVPDILERRVPHRAGHLEHAGRWRDEGRLLLGGAVGDPPHSGLLVFRVDDPGAVEEFVAADPYVREGLVTAHRVEPWVVAVQ
jgi:uncharacterized protein YciI